MGGSPAGVLMSSRFSGGSVLVMTSCLSWNAVGVTLAMVQVSLPSGGVQGIILGWRRLPALSRILSLSRPTDGGIMQERCHPFGKIGDKLPSSSCTVGGRHLLNVGRRSLRPARI